MLILHFWARKPEGSSKTEVEVPWGGEGGFVCHVAPMGGVLPRKIHKKLLDKQKKHHFVNFL